MPSSVIAGIKYFNDRKTLRVFYLSGSIYDYKDVPEKIFNAMKTAFSKGTYLNKYIKPKYKFEKITDA